MRAILLILPLLLPADPKKLRRHRNAGHHAFGQAPRMESCNRFVKTGDRPDRESDGLLSAGRP